MADDHSPVPLTRERLRELQLQAQREINQAARAAEQATPPQQRWTLGQFMAGTNANTHSLHPRADFQGRTEPWSWNNPGPTITAAEQRTLKKYQK